MTKQRMQRERKTIRLMIEIHCRGRHRQRGAFSGTELCPSCEQLLAYAMRRIDQCVFAPAKPTCAKCPIHCYSKGWREQVREVMHYAGPRMLFRHPILALHHLIDGFKAPPARPKRGNGTHH